MGTVSSLHDELSCLLRARRKALSLTQAELARRSGVSRQTVIAIEEGRDVSGHSLLSVMGSLGVSVTVPSSVSAGSSRPTIKSLMRAQRLSQAGS